MNNGDMPAVPGPSTENDGAPYYRSIPFVGLTKREAFAMAAMQGIATADSDDVLTWEDIGKSAVTAADALLKALEES